MNIGNCWPWFWIFMPTLLMCLISRDLMGLPSITSTYFLCSHCWSGTWWWWTKSISINAMPVAPQSMSTCVCISWLFMVNVQIITKCFTSIDPSNTFTLLTERPEMPKHFKAFETKLFPLTKEPSFINWPEFFLIPQNLTRFLLLRPRLQPPQLSEPFS